MGVEGEGWGGGGEGRGSRKDCSVLTRSEATRRTYPP